MEENKTNKFLVFVLIIIAVRILASWFIPLTDNTEARYGEIARLMVEINDWVVLHMDNNTPFWAKPPLSTWLSAASVELFGLSEFSLRLPSFILSLLLIVIVGRWAMRFSSKTFWFFSFLVLITPEYLLHAGLLSTDTALNFSIALVMISFWKAMDAPLNKKGVWSYSFFLALALGCLSKGPIVFVLTAPPLFLWCLIKNKWKLLLSQFNWWLGIPLFLLITVPWYWLCESRSPGFINYFLIGEHFKRFIEPGWKGDLYGEGHSRPMGSIWLFLFAFVPQSLYVIYRLIKDRFSFKQDSWLVFLVLWMFWTPLFFTISKNILHTYNLPCVIPCALILVYWVKENHYRVWKNIGGVLVLILLIASVVYSLNYIKISNNVNSDKVIIMSNIERNDYPIVYWAVGSYSSTYYTKGKVLVINTVPSLVSYLNDKQPFYLFVPKRFYNDIKGYIKDMKMIGENNTAYLFVSE